MRALAIVAILMVTTLAACAGPPQVPPEAPPETPQEPAPAESKEITIVDYHIDVCRLQGPFVEAHAKLRVDEFYPQLEVLLRNEGNTPVEIDKIVFSSGKSKIEEKLAGVSATYILEPKEEENFYVPQPPHGGSLEKEIGAHQLKATISILGPSGEILAKEDVTIPLPIARIGDTISLDSMSLTPLEWKESNVVTEGPYAGNVYYTFTAKPDMKFIILTYRFENNSKRPQETPYLDAGEIGTDKGYIYPLWYPAGGAWAAEYKPRKATAEEITTLLLYPSAYEELLPGKSATDRLAFEIPKDENPVEASIKQVFPTIQFGN